VAAGGLIRNPTNLTIPNMVYILCIIGLEIQQFLYIVLHSDLPFVYLRHRENTQKSGFSLFSTSLTTMYLLILYYLV
jgi:hypothetical protein